MFSISNSNAFQLLAQRWSPVIEKKLQDELPSFEYSVDPIWQKAVTAAVFDGGKRTRPFLTILGWQTFVNEPINPQHTLEIEAVLNIAVAVELIHSSSLIFDDLPCMDNATLRRGNQALHLEIGEDKAILVALALLMKGIQLVILATNTLSSKLIRDKISIQLLDCIGTKGLICGQWFDLSSKQSVRDNHNDSNLLALRNLKTMPLIRFALLSGAILANATENQQNILANFAEQIGEAYQQLDDLLDLTTDSNLLGKDLALDKKNDRINDAYVSLDSAIMEIERKFTKAHSLIEENFPNNTNIKPLIGFVDSLYARFKEVLESFSNTKVD